MGKLVTVYFFEKYDIVSDEYLRSKRPATLKAIADVQGRPLMETAQEIDEADLDDDGFKRRK